MKKEEQETKYLILGIAKDQIKNFTYYDRKECEQLPEKVLDRAIMSGLVSIHEICEAFKEELFKTYPTVKK